jgi:hypothetical protein
VDRSFVDRRRVCHYFQCLKFGVHTSLSPGLSIEPSGRPRIARFASVAFPLTEKGRHSDLSFSQLNGPPASTSVYASL